MTDDTLREAQEEYDEHMRLLGADHPETQQALTRLEALGGHGDPVTATLSPVEPRGARGSTGTVLAIDFGTTNTAAAFCAPGGEAESVEFDDPDSGSGKAKQVRSCVVVSEDGERFETGFAAYNQQGIVGARFQRTPKALIGKADEVGAGTQRVRVERLVAAVLADVYAEALKGRTEPPEQVVLTHPAHWRKRQLGVLHAAAELAGLPVPELLNEAEAAVRWYASRHPEELSPGTTLAVYDLGGGTFDAAVLRVADGQHFELAGVPVARGGELGGELFDDLLLKWAADELRRDDEDAWEILFGLDDEGRWFDERLRFRHQMRIAKHALSRPDATQTSVQLPRGSVTQKLILTRETLNEQVRAPLEESLKLLGQALADAGVDRQGLAAVYVAGGSSEIPLVAELVEKQFETAVKLGDPKYVVSLGAAEAFVASDSREPEDGPEKPPETESRLLASVSFAKANDSSIYAVTADNGRAAELLRLDLATGQTLELVALAEKPTSFDASNDTVAVVVGERVQLFDAELRQKAEEEMISPDKVVAGPGFAWAWGLASREVGAGELDGVPMLSQEITLSRIALAPGIARFDIGPGINLLFIAPEGVPRPLFLNKGDRSGGVIVAGLACAEKRMLQKAKLWQRVLILGAEEAPDAAEIVQRSFDWAEPPWLTQVAFEGAAALFADERGLKIGDTYAVTGDGYFRWVLTQLTPFGLNVRSDGTLVYIPSEGGLALLRQEPGSYLGCGDGAEGVCLGFESAGETKLVFLAEDRAAEIRRSGRSEPIAVTGGTVYCLESREKEAGEEHVKSNLVRIPLPSG